jgi:hypothetical protein
VTGLWTNDRDTLAEALLPWRANQEYPADKFDRDWADEFATVLIDDGVVRVLDPDDTELVEQGAQTLWSKGLPHDAGLVWDLLPETAREHYRVGARAVIEALRQP